MAHFIFLFLLIPFFAHTDWEELFDDEDPSLYHHVNVISGHLNLCMQDTVVQGAIPLPLTRTYSSAGAFEKMDGADLELKHKRGGWLIQGGWNFLPHTNLLIVPISTTKGYKYAAFLSDRSGSVVPYIYDRQEKDMVFLKPDPSYVKHTTVLGARTSIQNYLLQLDLDKGQAQLFLPNGGRSKFEGKRLKRRTTQHGNKYYYRLVLEVSPSQKIIRYSYDDDERLEQVETRNPDNTKTFSWIHFDLVDTDTPFHFKLQTSDAKNLDYKALEHAERDYICEVSSACRPHETCEYSDARKGLGARMQSLEFAEKKQFFVTYYMPVDKKIASKWFDEPEKKPFEADKVKTLSAPVGPNNEMLPIANFTYHKKYTDVRDSQNILTRYHHENERLTWVEYFNEQDQLVSMMRFLWDGPKLISKAFYNEKRQPLFSKTFKYDELGNVIEEALSGNLSGNAMGPFSQSDEDKLQGAEVFSKRFAYLPHFNVPVQEEQDGLTYKYSYKPDTDLLSAKFTCDQNRILLREFFFYDNDNILVAEITDDGTSINPNDLSNVTERHIRRYEIHTPIGLPIAMIELYWDFKTNREVMLKKSRYCYGPNYLVSVEEVYDANNAHRYTLYTDYNDQGRIVRKTNAVGQESSYTYDTQDNLLESIEPGAPKKIFTNDIAGRPTSCLEIYADGSQRTTHNTFDTKGNIFTQTDSAVNTTFQTYDPFGRCLATQFPPVPDESGSLYAPVIYFTYDAHGNLASSTTPKGEITRTWYNTLRKPILIIQPDGSQTRHEYNKNGTLRKTTLPDNTAIEYTYDLLQRITSKKVIGASGDVLDAEYWTYNNLHLIHHQNAQGLSTTYTYDGAGRKIAENTHGRATTYEYDALGFLQRTNQAESSHIEVHDAGGRTVAEWNEDIAGRIENHMHFFYNSDGRKEKAVRSTSQGDAVDYFHYDPQGRLRAHVDPLNGVTWFHHNDFFRNNQGQYVLQKIIVDPIGNSTLETHDAAGRLISTEKQTPDGKTTALEEYYYDRSGNQCVLSATVFTNQQISDQRRIIWDYDICGRVIQEMEQGEKITRFSYDSKGRIASKTLPNGTSFTYSYDGLDRLLEQKSSDGTIHYRYNYAFGPAPTLVHDVINNTTLSRSYDLFGELLAETNPFGLTTRYEYDIQGRRTRFTLPDHSSINYTYSGAHLHTIQRKNYTHTYTHFDPNGHITQETLINGQTLTTARDLLERPTSQSSSHLTHTAAYTPSHLLRQTENSLFGTTNYIYDSLNQLTQEGTAFHSFDSLGNPTDCTIGSCNQIVQTPDNSLSYDPNGNPTRRTPEITYTYDALGRLTSISTKRRYVRYIYDAFSRLIAKEAHDSESRTEKHCFLYDHDREIGIITPDGTITQLKVLGLGLKGDLGAAIAIEISSQIYAPLHDFNGNLIALVTTNGILAQSYQLTAFGIDLSHDPISPWRFASKRTDESLVYFGQRFYDPSLKRWLTPDPSGYTNSPNLYLFVLNSPLNRLDLFGLDSENFLSSSIPGYKPFAIENFRISAPISYLNDLPTNQPLHCSGIINAVNVDFIVVNGGLNKLNFTPWEKHVGSVNILNHFHEMMPSKGKTIGLITVHNGINTSLAELAQTCKFVSEQIPEETLVIGFYNPTNGIVNDLGRVHRERKGWTNPQVNMLSQFLYLTAEALEKINPNLLQVHLMHSEATLQTKCGVENNMNNAQRALLQKHTYFLGFGGAAPFPIDYGYYAKFIYSKRDYITKGFTSSCRNNPNYDIQFIPCKSSWKEKILGFADHGMQARTYRRSSRKNIDYLRTDIGFTNVKDR